MEIQNKRRCRDKGVWVYAGSRTNIVGNVRYNRWLAALLQDERKKMDGCKRKFNDQVAPQKFFSSGYSGYARLKKEG